MKIFFQYIKNFTIKKDNKTNLSLEKTQFEEIKLSKENSDISLENNFEISIENFNEQISFDENFFLNEMSELKTEPKRKVLSYTITIENKFDEDKNISSKKSEVINMSPKLSEISYINKLSPKSDNKKAYILTYLTPKEPNSQNLKTKQKQIGTRTRLNGRLRKLN